MTAYVPTTDRRHRYGAWLLELGGIAVLAGLRLCAYRR